MTEPSLRTFLSSGTKRERARWAVRLITPWGLEWWLWRRSIRRELEVRQARNPPARDSRVEESIRFLGERGLDELHVREGSMPEASLEYLATTTKDHLPPRQPVRVLHMGNFVGVSLCYVSSFVKDHHPESLVVSIDPNIAHRGVDNPQSHLLALLGHFDLLRHNLVITGYTLERPPASKDACEGVLEMLTDVAGARFDLVIIDADHDEAYLRREVAAVRPLLADGGMLAFDDVGDWPGVAQNFADLLGEEAFLQLGNDGRVGILQARTTPGSE